MIDIPNPSGCLALTGRRIRKTNTTPKSKTMSKTIALAVLALAAAAATVAAQAAPVRHIVTVTASGLASDSVALTIDTTGSTVAPAGAIWWLGAPQPGRAAFASFAGADLVHAYSDGAHYKTAFIELSDAVTTFAGINLDQRTFDGWAPTVTPFYAERPAIGGSVTFTWADGFEAYLPAASIFAGPLSYADAYVPAVPEPTQSALLLAGLLAVGFAARKTGGAA